MKSILLNTVSALAFTVIIAQSAQARDEIATYTTAATANTSIAVGEENPSSTTRAKKKKLMKAKKNAPPIISTAKLTDAQIDSFIQDHMQKPEEVSLFLETNHIELGRIQKVTGYNDAEITRWVNSSNNRYLKRLLATNTLIKPGHAQSLPTTPLTPKNPPAIQPIKTPPVTIQPIKLPPITTQPIKPVATTSPVKPVANIDPIRSTEPVPVATTSTVGPTPQHVRLEDPTAPLTIDSEGTISHNPITIQPVKPVVTTTPMTPAYKDYLKQYDPSRGVPQASPADYGSLQAIVARQKELGARAGDKTNPPSAAELTQLQKEYKALEREMREVQYKILGGKQMPIPTGRLPSGFTVLADGSVKNPHGEIVGSIGKYSGRFYDLNGHNQGEDWVNMKKAVFAGMSDTSVPAPNPSTTQPVPQSFIVTLPPVGKVKTLSNGNTIDSDGSIKDPHGTFLGRILENGLLLNVSGKPIDTAPEKTTLLNAAGATTSPVRATGIATVDNASNGGAASAIGAGVAPTPGIQGSINAQQSYYGNNDDLSAQVASVKATLAANAKIPKPAKGETFAIGGTGYKVNDGGILTDPYGSQVAKYNFTTGNYTQLNGKPFLNGEDRHYGSLYASVLTAQQDQVKTSANVQAFLEQLDSIHPSAAVMEKFNNDPFYDMNGAPADAFNIARVSRLFLGDLRKQVASQYNEMTEAQQQEFDQALQLRANTLAKNAINGAAAVAKAAADPNPQDTYNKTYWENWSKGHTPESWSGTPEEYAAYMYKKQQGADQGYDCGSEMSRLSPTGSALCASHQDPASLAAKAAVGSSIKPSTDLPPKTPVETSTEIRPSTDIPRKTDPVWEVK